MNATFRRVPRAVVVFVVSLFIITPAGPDRLRGLLHATQATQASDLDRALQAGDLDKARQLVPANWAAAEALFISYLERAYISPGAASAGLDARTLASRLADVFFRIVEYDVAPSLVSTLEGADAARRRQLIAVTRELFSNLERRRTIPKTSIPNEYNERGLPIYKALSDVADRFRALSFRRGELFALFCMADIKPPVPRVHRLARELGDELSRVLVWRQSAGSGAGDPQLEPLLEIAERRGVLNTQFDFLTQMGRMRYMSSGPDRSNVKALEQALMYLERARIVARKIPPLETMNFAWYTASGPEILSFGLPEIFGAAYRLQRPELGAQALLEGLQIAQRLGENVQIYAVRRFAAESGGVDSDAAASLLRAARPLGARIELTVMRGLAGSGPNFRSDVAEKALALAVALLDPQERANSLRWYSNARPGPAKAPASKPGVPPPAARPSPDLDPMPPLYRELFQMCVEAGQFEVAAEAVANRADKLGVSGYYSAALEKFNEALGLADRSANKRAAAQLAIRAVTGITPSSTALPTMPRRQWAPAVQLDLTNRAVEAARAADSPTDVMKALLTRALVPLATSDERAADLREAAAIAARYTDQTRQASYELECLRRVAEDSVRRGQYQAAIDAELRRAERSHAFEQAAPTSHEVQAYLSMGRIYSTNLGEPRLAFQAADRARTLAEASLAKADLPVDWVEPWSTYHGLAAMAADIGRPVEALEFYDKALQALAGQDAETIVPMERRRILGSRADLYQRLGDFQAALRDRDEISSLLNATIDNFNLSEAIQRAQWLSEVAWTNALAGDFDKAVARARDVVLVFRDDKSQRWEVAGMPVTVRRKFFFTNPEEVVASVIRFVVDILILSGNAGEAIAFCDLPGIHNQLAGRPVAERIHVEHLARACVKAGQFDRARALLLSAAEIDRKHSTALVGGLGGSLLELGLLEIEARNYAKAKEYLLAARDAANPYDLNQIWRIERALALVLARIGDVTAAEARYERALTALESTREHVRPEEFRLLYGESQDDIYESYAGLLAERAVSSAQQADAMRAFQAAERKRTQMLRNLLATGWSRIPPEAIPDQVRRAVDMEARIGAKHTLLREQFALPVDKRNAAMVETLQRDLEKLQSEHRVLLSSLAQGRYRYAAPATLAASLAAPVQAALGSARVLVEYQVAADRSYAFVVSGAGVKVVPLAVGRATLRQQVEHLLAPFRQLRSGEVDLARLGYDTTAAHALYTAIFAPVQPHLGPASEVVIVPDDVLHFLPFDALVDRPQDGEPRGPVLHGQFAGASFLLRRYAISYVTSAAELVSSAPAARPSSARERLFAMANPTAGRATSASTEDDPLKRQLRSGAFDAFLGPLPGAEAEVRRVGRLFPPNAVTVVSGRAATETAYDSNAGRFGIIHFATHAVASDGQPLYSTLVLAPDPAGGHDGFLQAFEVLRTPLRADLVVLSGCETALGGENQGHGLLGLVAAFQQAGARSVLATLWSIDEAAAEMTTAFYRSLVQGRRPAAALRQAKLHLLQRRVRMGNVDVSLAHPFFWAPFILVGTSGNR